MSNLFVNYVKQHNLNVLDDGQINSLLVDYRVNGSLESRDRLLSNFYPMILHIINSNVPDSSKREDYISVAYMALSKCIDNYEMESYAKFSSLAFKYITNAVRQESFKNTGLINIPYVESVNAKKYLSAKRKLEETYGRKLSLEEMADLLNLKPNKILDYENETADIYSFNDKIGENITLGEVIKDEYSLEEEVEAKNNTETLMNNISMLKDKRQQLILLYTYGFMDGVEHTQEEARDMLVKNGYESMSRQNVQKLQKKALNELREMYN